MKCILIFIQILTLLSCTGENKIIVEDSKALSKPDTNVQHLISGTAFNNLTSIIIRDFAADFPEKDSIKLEFEKYGYAGWGSVLAKPIDTIYSAKSLTIMYGNTHIYTDSVNNFTYYKNLKDYWPRLLKINNIYVYMFERVHDPGELIAADIFMISFNKNKMIDTLSAPDIKYDIDLSKKLTDRELFRIYKLVR